MNTKENAPEAGIVWDSFVPLVFAPLVFVTLVFVPLVFVPLVFAPLVFVPPVFVPLVFRDTSSSSAGKMLSPFLSSGCRGWREERECEREERGGT